MNINDVEPAVKAGIEAARNAHTGRWTNKEYVIAETAAKVAVTFIMAVTAREALKPADIASRR